MFLADDTRVVLDIFFLSQSINLFVYFILKLLCQLLVLNVTLLLLQEPLLIKTSFCLLFLQHPLLPLFITVCFCLLLSLHFQFLRFLLLFLHQLKLNSIFLLQPLNPNPFIKFHLYSLIFKLFLTLNCKCLPLTSLCILDWWLKLLMVYRILIYCILNLFWHKFRLNHLHFLN